MDALQEEFAKIFEECTGEFPTTCDPYIWGQFESAFFWFEKGRLTPVAPDRAIEWPPMFWVRSATPLALDNKEGIGPHLRESASGLGSQVAAEQANEAASTQQGDFGEIMEQEVYEGLLLAVLAASAKKVKAGLRHTVSSKYQEYPPCTLELGVALDAIDMIVADILHFVEVNVKPL